MTNVHFFYDPLCGWCYGATALINTLAEQAEFNVIAHPGGMLEKRVLPTELKQFILQADPRIAALTGVKFGDAYTQRLQSDADMVVDSYLPTRAILVAQEMGVDSLVMLKAIQEAHYLHGQPVEQLATLASLAEQHQLDMDEWHNKMAAAENSTNAVIADSHELMHQWHVTGYPTLIAEINGSLVKLPHEQFYGNVNGWRELLNTVQK